MSRSPGLGGGVAAPCPWVLGCWQRGAGRLESLGCFSHPHAAPEQSLPVVEGNLQENQAAGGKNGHFGRLHRGAQPRSQ